MQQSVTWKIAGEAGFGIMSSGIMLARTFTRSGYYVFAANDYPSLIRGGHNVVSVRVSSVPFRSMNRDLHILVALNTDTVEMHKNEIGGHTAIIYDPRDKEWSLQDFSGPVKLFPLPLRDLVNSLGADFIMRNTVALGASVAVMGGPFEKLSSVIHDQFIRKGQEVVDKNIAIAKAGFDYVRSHYGSDVSFHLEPGTHTDTLAVVNGSEALGLGAVRAGLKFAAIYPMTPINALITFLADHAKELGVVYKQPEDEVAGINMALGASVGGVRSMVATSGGGFDLMTEGLSLAGMIETPLVVDLGMRTGPATGMPTYTEQGDLMLAIHAGHGEFPRIVLAPGDARETFEMTIEAFNLADRYQTQVIILTDKYLNESHWTIPLEPLNKAAGIDRGKLVTGGLPAEPVFMRYADMPDGVSPRSVPGTPNGIFVANSYEHDESGHVTDKRQARKAMVDKRMRKFSGIMKAARPPVYTGDEHPDVLLVTWGTTQGPVLDAVELLRRQGTSAAALCYTWMYPFPAEASLDMLKRCARVVDIELNATGQLARLVREQTGFDIREKILRYDGRTLTPEEIVEKLR